MNKGRKKPKISMFSQSIKVIKIATNPRQPKKINLDKI